MKFLSLASLVVSAFIAHGVFASEAINAKMNKHKQQSVMEKQMNRPGNLHYFRDGGTEKFSHRENMGSLPLKERKAHHGIHHAPENIYTQKNYGSFIDEIYAVPSIYSELDAYFDNSLKVNQKHKNLSTKDKMRYKRAMKEEFMKMTPEEKKAARQRWKENRVRKFQDSDND